MPMLEIFEFQKLSFLFCPKIVKIYGILLKRKFMIKMSEKERKAVGMYLYLILYRKNICFI